MDNSLLLRFLQELPYGLLHDKKCYFSKPHNEENYPVYILKDKLFGYLWRTSVQYKGLSSAILLFYRLPELTFSKMFKNFPLVISRAKGNQETRNIRRHTQVLVRPCISEWHQLYYYQIKKGTTKHTIGQSQEHYVCLKDTPLSFVRLE